MNSVNYELFNVLALVSVVVSEVSIELDISRDHDRSHAEQGPDYLLIYIVVKLYYAFLIV